MDYITTIEASEKWGITSNRITILAKKGRIAGAKQIGSRWMIPKDAQKPIDGRKLKNQKNEPEQVSFRYPIFEHRELGLFNPPLSAAEMQLKKAGEAFHACRFRDAEGILGDLPEVAQDKYIRITALYESCMINIFLGNTERFFKCYAALRTELEEEFPYKREMKEFLNEIDATLGSGDYYSKEFEISPGYDYHESFLPHLGVLCAVSFVMPQEKPTAAELRAHELNCVLLEKTTAYTDIQSMHIYLGCAYASIKEYDKMTYHFKKALKIAEKYELLYIPAVQYFYMRNLFRPALSGFSEKFRKRLIRVSDDMHNRYVAFTDKIALNNIYKLISGQDYMYLYYCVQGMTHKEVASIFKSSETSVGKRYAQIYKTLGVGGKKEMLEMYRRSVNTDIPKR